MSYHARNFDWKRAQIAGLEMAMDHVRKGQGVTDRDIWWALLCEAAEVARLCYSAPPRTGMPRKSAMPDAPDEVSDWQLISAYLNGTLEEMPTDESQPPQPSAEQVTRSEMVLWVWHEAALKENGDWKRMRKAVYLKACGVPDRKVRAVTGFTRQRIHSAKNTAMQDMADFVSLLTKRQNRVGSEAS